MKIVSFNVNGLRPRAKEFGGLKKLLDALDADIICLQETKLVRPDLSADVAVADGYESFFAFPRGKYYRSGWSGVATFCRTGGVTSSASPVLPTAAEEGFTGVLHLREGGVIADGCIGHYERVWAGETGSRSQLEELDQEGRVVVTDHGAFVLFNIYGPCVQAGDEPRIRFKLSFYQTLQRRWQSLLEAGRRVVVVGDLNIAPAQVDSCHSGPDFDSSPSRQWLNSVLRSSGGPFTDSFRLRHPERREAYTCFSTASGAAAFNYGSRIDLILVAGPCQHAWGRYLESVKTTEVRGSRQDAEKSRSFPLDSGARGEEPPTVEAAACSKSEEGTESNGKAHRLLITDENGTNLGNGGVAGGGLDGLSGSLQAHLFEEFRDALRRHVPGVNDTLSASAPSTRSGAVKAASGILIADPHTVDTEIEEVGPQKAADDVASQPTQPLLPEEASSRTGDTYPNVGEASCSCSGRSDAYGFAECGVLDADILSQFPGSSDHRPVYVRLRGQRDVALHKVPPLSTRYMPELRGKQTRILGYFGNSAKTSYTPAELVTKESSFLEENGVSSSTTMRTQIAEPTADSKLAEQDPVRKDAPTANGTSSRATEVGKKRKGTEGSRPAKQRSLRELFGVTVKTARSKQETAAVLPIPSASSGGVNNVYPRVEFALCATSASGRLEREGEIEDTSSAEAWGPPFGNKGVVEMEKRVSKDPAADWARLRQRMAARHPVCRHNEPAVARVVKKAGPTVGRTFYCCARATGPSSNPEARCDYFEWAKSNTAKSRSFSGARTG